MSESVQENVVLISGASGGLGQAMVQAFRALNWRVVAGWHRSPFPDEGQDIWPIQLDITSAAQVEEAFGQIIHRWNRIDALINNAGVTVDELFWQLEMADWDHVIDVNLKGAFLCSRAAMAQMSKQRSGHIINIASFAARQGPRGQANYAAAKAGLIGLTLSLAKEAGGDNVRLNAVLPGVLATHMTAKLSLDILNGFKQANALGRLNSTTEVARFVAFLAGCENISGQVFQLDSRIARWT